MDPWNNPNIQAAASRLAAGESMARVDLNSDEYALAYYLSRVLRRLVAAMHEENH